MLLDNGRTAVLADAEGRDALNCIRCSACLNVCPVYERAGGHAYGSVYPGPIGAILSPQLTGVEDNASLPYASSLCGACYDVCPVKINIPEILVHLRAEHTEAYAAEHRTPSAEAAAMAARRLGDAQPEALGAGPAQRPARAGPRPAARRDRGGAAAGDRAVDRRPRPAAAAAADLPGLVGHRSMSDERARGGAGPDPGRARRRTAAGPGVRRHRPGLPHHLRPRARSAGRAAGRPAGGLQGAGPHVRRGRRWPGRSPPALAERGVRSLRGARRARPGLAARTSMRSVRIDGPMGR